MRMGKPLLKENVKKGLKTRNKFPVWLLSYPPFYDMEADCFPVSDNIENKSDLPQIEGVPNLKGQKKKRQAQVR